MLLTHFLNWKALRRCQLIFIVCATEVLEPGRVRGKAADLLLENIDVYFNEAMNGRSVSYEISSVVLPVWYITRHTMHRLSS